MALNTCPECGKEISSEDKICPNCGFPIKQPKEKKEDKCTFEKVINEYEESKSKTPSISSNLSYTKKSLLEGEQIIAEAKWSRFMYVFSALMICGSLACIVLWMVFISDWYLDNGVAWSTFFPLWIIFLIGAIVLLISVQYDEFVITNKRVIVKAGVFIRSAFELKIEMLESVNVYQGIFGRIFKFGTIGICGIGASRCWVNFIADPMEFRNKFYEIYYKVKSVDSAKVNQNM